MLVSQTGAQLGHGWGTAVDMYVIPVTHSSDAIAEARGKFILMTVLDLFKGEIYHLGLT